MSISGAKIRDKPWTAHPVCLFEFLLNAFEPLLPKGAIDWMSKWIISLFTTCYEEINKGKKALWQQQCRTHCELWSVDAFTASIVGSCCIPASPSLIETINCSNELRQREATRICVCIFAAPPRLWLMSRVREITMEKAQPIASLAQVLNCIEYQHSN